MNLKNATNKKKMIEKGDFFLNFVHNLKKILIK